MAQGNRPRRGARLASNAAFLLLLVVPPLDMLMPAPAGAQTYKALRVQCFLADADPDVKVRGCTAVIEGARESKATLARAHFHRGNGLAMKKEFRQAIADYDAALNLAPRSADILFRRGLARLEMQDSDGGNADIEAARQINPRVADKDSGMQR